MFLRQNFIFCRLRLWGSGVWGAVWGSLLPCCCLRVIKRLRWLFFEVVRISAKKQGFKKMWCYNIFSHFYMSRSRADHGLISWNFRRLWACKGLQGLYITLFSVIFWSGRASASFQACFLRVLRPRLPSCWCWWVLIPSSCEQVGLYICIYR